MIIDVPYIPAVIEFVCNWGNGAFINWRIVNIHLVIDSVGSCESGFAAVSIIGGANSL